MIQRVRARFSRSLSYGLAWLASLSPRLAFRVCDVLAVFLALGSRRPSRATLRAMFPQLSSRETGRVLRRIKASYARSVLLSGWIRRGGRTTTLTQVHDSDAVRALRPPMIVSTFHIGPTLGLSVLSEWLQGEPLVLRGTQHPIDRDRSPDANVNLIEGTDQQRAATFHRAIERLRSNGFVILALDPHEAHRIATPFLGGTLQLARGPFAMSRVARAPIVPVVARWIGNEIELVVGEPLEVHDHEQALAASAAQWLEGYLREWPGELSPRILELMRPLT